MFASKALRITWNRGRWGSAMSAGLLQGHWIQLDHSKTTLVVSVAGKLSHQSHSVISVCALATFAAAGGTGEAGLKGLLDGPTDEGVDCIEAPIRAFDQVVNHVQVVETASLLVRG